MIPRCLARGGRRYSPICKQFIWFQKEFWNVTAWLLLKKQHWIVYPTVDLCMAWFTNIYHRIKPSVDEYIIHGSYGYSKHLGVSKNRGTPKWMVYNGKHMENPIKMDDLGVSLFSETLISESNCRMARVKVSESPPFSSDVIWGLVQDVPAGSYARFGPHFAILLTFEMDVYIYIYNAGFKFTYIQ